MNYVNCTTHAINLNNGRVFEPSGIVARVAETFEDVSHCTVSAATSAGACAEAQTFGYCESECLGWEPEFDSQYGEITGLPEPVEGTLYIVSGLVLSAAKAQGRTDCRGPATGHPETVRNDKGHIVSVPGLVR